MSYQVTFVNDLNQMVHISPLTGGDVDNLIKVLYGDPRKRMPLEISPKALDLILEWVKTTQRAWECESLGSTMRSWFCQGVDLRVIPLPQTACA